MNKNSQINKAIHDTQQKQNINDSNQSILGIQLVNRDPTSFSVREGYIREEKIAQSVVTEKGWTLNDMVTRPCFIDTYPWLLSSPRIIKRLKIPQDLLVSTINSTPFNAFTLARFDTELTFQVTATPLHQGLMAAVFIPLTTQSFIDNTMLINFSTLSVNQVVYLYANTNTVAKMVIPFNSPQSYINLNDLTAGTIEGSLGYVYLINLNPISFGTSASDSASINVYSQFINTEFKVPRISNQLTTTLVPAFAQGDIIGNLVSNLPNILGDLTQSTTTPQDVKHTHVNNNNTYNLDNRSKPQKTLSRIVDKVLPKNMLTDALDMFGMMGLDKPTIPLTSLPTPIKSNNYLNFGEGPDNIDKLHLYPNAISECTPEHFATTNDEMNFDIIKRKYTYLDTFTMSDIQGVGSVLYSIPMNPMPNYKNMVYGSTYPTPTISYPLISYISYPFNFWRGSITYKIQVIATSFQTGKVFFSLNYGSLITPANPIAFTSQYGAAFEINQGSNEFEFTAPYVAITPYLNIPNTFKPRLNDSMGLMSVMVMNPLVAPNNTPKIISFNIFIAAGEDFDVSMLGMSNNIIPISYYPPAIAQGTINPAPLNITETSTSYSDDNKLAPQSTTNIHEWTHFGCKFDSIKTLLKKYQLVQSFPPGNTYFTLDVNSIFTKIPYSTFGTPIPQISTGLLAWGSAPFRQFRGQIRFKVVMRGALETNFMVMFTPAQFPADLYSQSVAATVTPAIPFDVSVKTIAHDNTRICSASNSAPTSVLEFEIPYASRFNSVLTLTGPQENLDAFELSALGKIFIFPTVEQFQYSRIDVYASLGDEARFGTLFMVPPILVNAVYDSTGLISAVSPDVFHIPT